MTAREKAERAYKAGVAAARATCEANLAAMRPQARKRLLAQVDEARRAGREAARSSVPEVAKRALRTVTASRGKKAGTRRKARKPKPEADRDWTEPLW